MISPNLNGISAINVFCSSQQRKFGSFRGVIMQQPCSRCGYVSDRPARFCRQCGAQLFTETETTSAPTRNYNPRQSSQPYSDPSAQTSGAGFDDQTPETSRLYRPPIGQGYPHYQHYPVAPEAPPKKSNAGVWILIAFLSLILVGGGMIGMVGYAVKRNYPAPAAPPPSDSIPEPGEPPPPPPGPEAEAADEATFEEKVPAELRRYVYPKAEVTEPVNVSGKQVVTMTTGDEIKKIKEFYTRLVGSPLVEDNSQRGKTLVFQTGESPVTLISIERDDDDPEKNRITLTRSPFVPKLK
jgi:hypothetical protein